MKPYFERDGVAIYHADCRDVLPLACDVVITDPPYSSVTHDGARGGAGDESLLDDAFGPIEIEDLRAIFGACRPARWCVATVDWRHCGPLEADPPDGLRFVRFGVWVKPNGAPQFTGDRPATGWEAVAILHKADVKMRWNGGGHHATWTIPKVSDEHPTTKPRALVRDFVQKFSEAGETILDPFMGSGTVLRAAMDLGRKAIGIEREERYCELAARRLDQMAMNLEVA